MKTHIDTKTGALILVAVVILVGIGIYAVVNSSKNSAALSVNPKVTFASEGQVAAGIPKELILEPQAAIIESYVAAGQSTVEWNSSSSIDALFNEYQNYFLNNNWNIVNEVATPSNVRGIYANQNAASANVTMVAQGSGSQITVSYIAN